MVTVTVDEITLNATRAALMERVNRLRLEVAYLETQASSEDRDRAFVWCVAAQQQTEMALAYFEAVEPLQDYPADMSLDQLTWTVA